MKTSFKNQNMENSAILDDLIQRYPKLEQLKDEIQKAANSLIRCYQQGGKVLVCGNGGSCSDSDHIVGEMMKGFEHKRPLEVSLKEKLSKVAGERGTFLAEKLQQGLPAISLTAHSALITAVANDIGADLIFAQQVVGYGCTSDVLIAITTSGNSQNIIDAILIARAKGMIIVGLTGETGGKIKSLCDILINVPESRTFLVQELHFPIYHSLCLMVENLLFKNLSV
jgi:phosphoheptose isomerase